MSSVPGRNTFVTAYAGQAPWDISRPQKAFLSVADRITLRGPAGPEGLDLQRGPAKGVVCRGGAGGVKDGQWLSGQWLVASILSFVADH